jgi:NADH-quinone oxidoreductase subunit H
MQFAQFMSTTWIGLIYYTLVFIFKSAIVVIILANVRTAFARWRIDQIVHAGWKVMVPLALLYLVVVQFVVAYAFPFLGVV